MRRFFVRTGAVIAGLAVAFTGMAGAAFGAEVQEHDIVALSVTGGLQAASSEATVFVTVVAVVPRCTRPAAVKAEVYELDGSSWVSVFSDPAQATARKCKLQGSKKWTGRVPVSRSTADSVSLSYGLG